MCGGFKHKKRRRITVKLKGKSALVTGAGRGIGRAIALRLAQEGANVTVNDIDAASADATATAVNGLGRRGLAAVADVSKQDAVEAMVQQHLAAFSGLDILVNNAGVVVVKSLFDHTEEDWDRLLAINLKSVYFCSRAAAPIMMAQRAGKIINTASMGAYRVQPIYAAYCASKAAVVNLTQSLAKELAPYNIQVNAVCPGIVDTDMWVQVNRNGGAVTGIENYMQSRIASIGLKRAASPDEVAAMYAFLASPDADYITGEVFKIHGGV